MSDEARESNDLSLSRCAVLNHCHVAKRMTRLLSVIQHLSFATDFSATCYFFGREVYKSLGGVPIGLIAADWGGQAIECFSSPGALADTTCGGTRPVGWLTEKSVGGDLSALLATRFVTATRPTYLPEEADHGRVRYLLQNQEGEAHEEAPHPNPGPTQLWNAMIHPLLPMRFTGVIWYQGENNVWAPASYACRFPAMIADWRTKFGLPDLSFFYVSLAAFADHRFAYLRSAQDAALALPRVGRALAIDLGDPSSPEGSIHPRRKQEVGRRLALAARVVQYNERGGLVADGPSLSSVQQMSGGAILGFDVGSADGLHLSGTAACRACCAESPFEVLSSSGSWVRATATVDHATQEVRLTSLSPILGIRLEWQGYPQCALYNGQGGPDGHSALPAHPFEWCAYPTGEGAWTGGGCSPRDPDSIYYPQVHVPSTRVTDYRLWGAAGMGKARTDSRCSTTNFRSGNPGTIGWIGVAHGIALSNHKLDAVSLAFRYIAGYTPSPGEHKRASTVSVELIDAHGKLIRALWESPPLGNYSYDSFHGFSPLVLVETRGLGLNFNGTATIALKVVNNERNLQIPLDDRAGGMSVTLGWVLEA